jgi:hypothetical protein
VKFACEPIKVVLENALKDIRAKFDFLVKNHQVSTQFLLDQISEAYNSREKAIVKTRSEEAKKNENRGVENANKEFMAAIDARHAESRNKLLASIEQVDDLYKSFSTNIQNSFIAHAQELYKLVSDVNQELTDYGIVSDEMQKLSENQLQRNASFYKIILQQQTDLFDDNMSSSISAYQNDLKQNVDAIGLDYETLKSYIERQIEDKKIEYNQHIREYENQVKDAEEVLNRVKADHEKICRDIINQTNNSRQNAKQSQLDLLSRAKRKLEELASSLALAGQKADDLYRQEIMDSQILTKDNIILNTNSPSDIKKENKWWIKKVRVDSR